jgi:hypothetical protein
MRLAKRGNFCSLKSAEQECRRFPQSQKPWKRHISSVRFRPVADTVRDLQIIAGFSVSNRKEFIMKRLIGVLLSILLMTVPFVSAAVLPSEDIRLSSVGYVPDREKKASVVSQTQGAFTVNREDGSEVFEGNLTAQGSVGIADFSEVTEEGTFYVQVDGLGRSISFSISKDAMVPVFQAVMLGFYAAILRMRISILSDNRA